MKLLHGSYGFDLLSLFLLITGGLISNGPITSILGLLLVFISLYRAISKNTYKRSSELYKFISIINKILGKFGKNIPYNLPKVDLNNFSNVFKNLKSKINMRKQYKIVKCKKCNQKLRLPRKKGKIIVTCKKCGYEFPLRT